MIFRCAIGGSRNVNYHTRSSIEDGKFRQYKSFRGGKLTIWSNPTTRSKVMAWDTSKCNIIFPTLGGMSFGNRCWFRKRLGGAT